MWKQQKINSRDSLPNHFFPPMLPAFQTCFILQIVYIKVRCRFPLRRFGHLTLHFDIVLHTADYHTQAPVTFIPRATSPHYSVLLPENQICAVPWGTLSVSSFFIKFGMLLGSGRRYFLRLCDFINQSLWGCLTEWKRKCQKHCPDQTDRR